MQRGNGAVIGKQNTPTTSVATGVWALNEVQRAVLGGTWPASTIVDPYFENVSLLLHGNGTNGAQNNTFLDSSTNNFTITRNGNTTQGTFTPYGSNWSNYFDNSGGYLTAPSNAALSMGTGQFWFEAWIFMPTAPSTQYIVLGTNAGSGSSALTVRIQPSALRVDRHGVASYDSNTVTWQYNAWQHIAVGRDSANTLYFFVNGVSVGTRASTTDNFAGESSAIGRIPADAGSAYFNGFISSLRLLKGTCLYTASFTPSISPLTAITNTSLLTCQSNRFIDNSSNNFAITLNGTVSVQRFSPFNPTAAYSAATIGGSGYFDGSGDFLALPASQTGLALSNSDFTFEAWVYRTSGTSAAFMLNGQGDGASVSGSSYAFLVGATGNSDLYVGSSVYSATNPNPPVGAWAHVAYVRTGGTFSTYLNGSRVGTVGTVGTGSVNAGSTLYVPSIGASSAGNTFLTGYIAGARLIKGSGGYDATQTTITVPTAPPTAVTNTQLLCNFTNGGIIDNAMMNDLETVGNAQISTSVSKFGGGSLAFDGTGDWLTLPSRPALDLGTGDFTIEFWTYLNTTASGQGFIGGTASGSYDVRWVSGTLYLGRVLVALDSSFAWSPSINTWYHVAITRSGSSVRAFINGTQIGTTATNTNAYNTAGSMTIGVTYPPTPDYPMNAYIDDLRITKGFARYTSNFSVPTAPFPDQ